jgi:hypothetical protein
MGGKENREKHGFSDFNQLPSSQETQTGASDSSFAVRGNLKAVEDIFKFLSSSWDLRLFIILY